jgi:hypothetical protein
MRVSRNMKLVPAVGRDARPRTAWERVMSDDEG